MFGLFKSKPRNPFSFPDDAVFVGKFGEITIYEYKTTTYEYSSESMGVDIVVVKHGRSKQISSVREQLELEEHDMPEIINPTIITKAKEEK